MEERDERICCPISTAAMFAAKGKVVYCGESCAWYDKHEAQCSMLALSRHLNEITRRLEDLDTAIKEKM